MGQADRTLRQNPKDGSGEELAADKKPLSHSVVYNLSHNKVVGYRHISPSERVAGGPVKEPTFELPLAKSEYDKIIKSVVSKHGATAAGARAAHDELLALSKKS